MRLKQAERRERERAEELEKEKQRRKQGQELQQIRNKLQDDDMTKLAELRRREKMEDKLARYGPRPSLGARNSEVMLIDWFCPTRQRVKEKIARDREERAQKVTDSAFFFVVKQTIMTGFFLTLLTKVWRWRNKYFSPAQPSVTHQSGPAPH